ncbi:MAG: penicillin-binding protein activator LpoB [Deltaproteobacteria bacterium]|nr:penicillin-binding protein activator LpoB [Deltaproteobacteria bacterium]
MKITLPSSLGLLLLAACASAPAPASGPTVERTDAALDLSGEWNDTDADQVAQAVIEDCLSAPWIGEWTLAHGKKPVVRLYPVRNKTDAYIDYRYFTKQIEAALIRSNRVDVVSSLEEAADNRDERADQATHAGDESAKSQGQELASDFLLNGWILASDDRASGKLLRAYLTSVEIVETQNNKKAWVGQKRIKKLITSAP